MSKKLRIGIIGVGAIGKTHAKAFSSSGEAEIAAVCDINEEALREVGEKFDVKKRFTDYRKLLESDVEGVLVCVGNALHKEVAIAALEAGKHVFLEKPMALNSAEADQIVKVSENTKGILQIGMMRRQTPAAQTVRKWVEKGLFGKIYHMRTVLIRRRGIPGLGGWFTTKAQSGGGPMIDLGVHWFDLAMWVSDLWKPTSVSAKTYAKFGPDMRDYKYVRMWAGPPKFDGTFDVEDYSTGFVRFGKTATLSFEIAWAANAKGESYVEFMGDKGGTRLLDGNPLTIYTEHEGALADIAPRIDDRPNHYDLQAQTFISACRGESPPPATAQQGLVVMKLIDANYKSSELNKEVEIEV